MKTNETTIKEVVYSVFGIGLICIGLSLLTGCGVDQSSFSELAAPCPCDSPAPQPNAVQTVVNNYNAYLASIGNDPIQPGLKCTLYNIPNMPANACLTVSSGSPGCSPVGLSTGFATVGTFTYTGAVDQPNQAGTAGFNMLPTALQSFYSTNFEVVCSGFFVNPDYTYHEFDVDSDDGSILWINGTEVVANDGLHAVTDVKAVKYLEAQVYSFQISYFQGPGNVALIVNEDGAVLPGAQLYH